MQKTYMMHEIEKFGLVIKGNRSIIAIKITK